MYISRASRRQTNVDAHAIPKRPIRVCISYTAYIHCFQLIVLHLIVTAQLYSWFNLFSLINKQGYFCHFFFGKWSNKDVIDWSLICIVKCRSDFWLAHGGIWGVDTLFLIWILYVWFFYLRLLTEICAHIYTFFLFSQNISNCSNP